MARVSGELRRGEWAQFRLQGPWYLTTGALCPGRGGRCAEGEDAPSESPRTDTSKQVPLSTKDSGTSRLLQAPKSTTSRLLEGFGCSQGPQAAPAGQLDKSSWRW